MKICGKDIKKYGNVASLEGSLEESLNDYILELQEEMVEGLNDYREDCKQKGINPLVVSHDHPEIITVNAYSKLILDLNKLFSTNYEINVFNLERYFSKKHPCFKK